MTTVPHSDFLRIGDLSSAALESLLDLAEAMAADPNGWAGAHAGETVALLFAHPSTRTRVSFAAAAHRLGMLPLELRADELQLSRGESIADTARALSAYVAAIVIRHPDDASIAELADAATVPVVNALSGEQHPCQALADVLTLRQRLGPLTGRTLAWVGRWTNVGRSSAEAALLSGMRVAVASPRGLGPTEAVVDVLAAASDAFTVVVDPRDAVRGADAVATDVWISMGDADDEGRAGLLAPYRVDEDLLAAAEPDAVFLHCLPAHRGEEVTAAVLDGPRSVVWQQAANRLPTEQALLHTLLR